MYLVVRHYEGASELFELLERRESDVRSVIQSVPGFRTYYLARTKEGGGLTITVCDDEAGADESTDKAAAWVRQNAPGMAAATPVVIEADVSFSFAGAIPDPDPTGLAPNESSGEPVVE